MVHYTCLPPPSVICRPIRYALGVAPYMMAKVKVKGCFKDSAQGLISQEKRVFQSIPILALYDGHRVQLGHFIHVQRTPQVVSENLYLWTYMIRLGFRYGANYGCLGAATCMRNAMHHVENRLGRVVVCVVITFSRRGSINQVWLPILLVVS